MQFSELVKKYDVPAPRYTSYPTVPYWTDTPTAQEWIESLRRTLTRDKNYSIYVHLPFCETLCSFCGCNTVITRNHNNEGEYLEALEKEWKNYKRLVPELESLLPKQFHLGGGTPTFFSAAHLERLLSNFLPRRGSAATQVEGSVEVDPRHCTREQLEVMYAYGFERISIGVQDLDPQVQRAVNRLQPLEMTQATVDSARSIGYTSVNFDLIYGLPKQTLASIAESMKKTLELRPDRIAFYSFAVVPWMKPAQSSLEKFLPNAEEKRHIFELGRTMLLEAGYVEIGMDHFALPDEALSQAMNSGELHRNFMGYTETKSSVLLGLGASSISESEDCYHQNEKNLADYYRRVAAGEIPTLRGHRLTEQDMQRRQQILDLMTRFETEVTLEQRETVRGLLSELIADQLVDLQEDTLTILPAGRPFLRNACVAFDDRMNAARPRDNLFSKAV
ncbi:MAG: oxygen-independent coproporphyrinogen III oxidase [Deltaproteobacteria bacterium]|nr:oxygen-independent coproporphyrinogen III oxidase [Deltaproteobacteria bacterium]